jgi:hypothetical protein
MARTSDRLLSHRLVAAATALIPPSRRDWGKAISAELACSSSRAERTRLALAAVRIVLLTPPGFISGLRGYARAALRSAVLALIAYVPIGLALYLLNVTFPSPQFAVPAVLGYGYPLLVLLTAGARARRASHRTGASIVAGVTAGLVLAILATATVAVLDNAFLSVIGQQQDNVAGFRDSGMTSMRAYLNRDLESLAPVVITIAVIAGAIFGRLGPVLATVLTPAATESSKRIHRIPDGK